MVIHPALCSEDEMSAAAPAEVQNLAPRSPLNAQVEEFLQNGGKIKEIPHGISGEKFDKLPLGESRKKIARQSHKMFMNRLTNHHGGQSTLHI